MSDPLGHQSATRRELLDGRVTDARLGHLAAGGAPDPDDQLELALAAWRDDVRDRPFPDYPQRVGRPVVAVLVVAAGFGVLTLSVWLLVYAVVKVLDAIGSTAS